MCHPYDSISCKLLQTGRIFLNQCCTVYHEKCRSIHSCKKKLLLLLYFQQCCKNEDQLLFWIYSQLWVFVSGTISYCIPIGISDQLPFQKYRFLRKWVEIERGVAVFQAKSVHFWRRYTYFGWLFQAAYSRRHISVILQNFSIKMIVNILQNVYF